MCCSTENGERGFTLVELLIAMALALIIIGALSSAFVSQRRTYAVQEEVSEMIQGARAAMDMIGQEVKMAGFNPSGATIVGAPYSTSQLEIRADLNGDGETDGTASNDDTNEEIIYTYDSTNKQIDRNTGGGAQPLAENIESFTFQYLDADGNATTTPANIREIRITIVARTAKEDPDYTDPTYGDGYRRYTLTSVITPPNLAL